MFDLYLLPIHLRSGQEFSTLPGFQAFKAPRRCERSRTDDVLLVRLHLMGGEQPGASELEEITAELAQAYYLTRGPVTTGLRAAVEAANEAMLVYNGRKRRGSEQSLGVLNLAALRREYLYLAHSGPARTFLITPGGLKDFYNPAASGRGLGLSKVSAITYFHTALEPESIALFFMELPPSLTPEMLSSGTRPSLNLLRRRLLSFPGVSFMAGAVQFKAGVTGEIHLLRPRPGPQDSSGDTIPVILSKPTVAPVEPLPQPLAGEEAAVTAVPSVPSEQPAPLPEEEKQVPAPEPMPEEPAILRAQDAVKEAVPTASESSLIIPVPYEGQQTRLPLPPLAEETGAAPLPVDSPPFVVEEELSPREMLRRRREAAATAAPAAAQKATRKPSTAGKPAGTRTYVVSPAQRRQMASAWKQGKEARQKFSDGVQKMLARLLPGTSDGSLQLSPAAMLFIALAVPLVVVILATTVYMRSGRSQQHELYLAQAQQAAAQAASQSDPALQRLNYMQAIEYLDQADDYQQSENSLRLRQQVYQALDTIDHITRLEFLPAFSSGFSPGVQITQIAASDTDVYLLDSAQGRVMRLFQTARGYDLDDTFRCSGAASQGAIGAIVDIAVIPTGLSDYAVMGVDAQGGVIQCKSGMDPAFSQLSPPDAGWGSIQAITIDRGSLYVLDPAGSMVYIYWDYFLGDALLDLFFDLTAETPPPSLVDMIDLAVDREELYLLKRNGSMTTCHYGYIEGNQSHCQDPAPYGDSRPGLQSQVLIFPETKFTQMQLTRRIDPALYVVDVQTPAIYRFSLKLNLDRQFRPSPFSAVPLPETAATAFAISVPSNMAPSEVIFLAFGNELYYANLR